MKKGEVWKVSLPPAAGHTQTGERPAIIVQNDRTIATLPTVLIVPLTGTPGSSRFDGTLPIQPNAQNGLTIPSVALVFQMRALDKRDFLHRMGELDLVTLNRILALVADLTG
jgi:mRNA interferase MazF